MKKRRTCFFRSKPWAPSLSWRDYGEVLRRPLMDTNREMELLLSGFLPENFYWDWAETLWS